MEGKCVYEILEKNHLVLMCLFGKVTSDSVINFIESLTKDENYSAEYDSLVDLRNSEMSYNLNDLKRTLTYIKGNKHFLAKRKTVYITLDSSQVVPPMSLKTESYQIPMEVKVTSTVSSAFDWLGLNIQTIEAVTAILDEWNC